MVERANQQCPECGSEQIVRGVSVGQSAESGKIGLSYRAALGLTGTEPIVADVCDGCGLLVRLYVKDVGKAWKRRGRAAPR